jgi:phosphate-selective porin
MKNNFHPFESGCWNLVDGFGAWQAVFQWSYLDLEDWRATAATAGHMNDYAAGLSWHWTPQMRWAFQYVRSEQSVGSNYTRKSQDIFATSVRVVF